jgi:FtsH-binding integral membrane protein
VTWGAPPEQPGYPPPPAFPPQPGYPPPPQQPSYPPQPYAQQPQAWGAPPPQHGGQQAWGDEQPAGMPHPSWNAPPQPPVDRGGRSIAGADATHGVSARVRFIRLTYLHLFGAICAFAGLEWLLFTNETLATKVSAPMTEFALGGRFNWGIVLAVFMVVSIGTHYLAEHTRSKPLHYIGLGLYVVAEALIFVPLLAIVHWKSAEIVAKGGGEPNIIRDAAYITLGVFGALTLSVLVTKKDFSFLRTGLVIAGAAASGLVILSLVFGFNLGIIFAVAMVLLAAGQILYETSQIMAHDDPESYVGASLSLFASVALMFWYVIRIVMKLRE